MMHIPASLVPLVAFLAGYLVGSVPLGLAVGYLFGKVDIRQYGTGNPGGSNIYHNIGFWPAAVASVGVFLQGVAPARLALIVTGDPWAATAAAVGTVVGSGWPVFMRFKGASSVGIATGAETGVWPLGLIALLIPYGSGKLINQLALGVITGFAVYTLAALLLQPAPVRVAALLILAIIGARRLNRLGDDLAQAPMTRVLWRRLLFDHRHGQRLRGPISDWRHA